MRGGHQPHRRGQPRQPGAALTAMLRGKSPFLPTPARLSLPPMLSSTLAKRPPGAPLPPDPSADGAPYIQMPQGYAPPATAPGLAPIRSGARRRVRR